MNWASIAEAALRGAIIGAIVGIPMTVYVVKKTQSLVIRDAESFGYTVAAIKPNWWYLGTKLRYNVSLTQAGRPFEASANVSARKSVTWTPSLAPPPAASVRSSDDNGQ